MMNTLNKQKGVVLVIGLLMLLVITIVGVTAMSSTTSNERMAANNQFQTISFQAAESAIHSVARPQELSPALISFPNPRATQNFAYDIDMNNAGATTVNVQASADIQFCGEMDSIGTQLGSKSINIKERIYDVFGTGSVGAINTNERHLMRVAHVRMPGYDLAFDNAVCEVIEE